MIKNLIYILILFISFANASIAQTQDGYLDYNVYEYIFQPQDNIKFLSNANKNMQMYEKTTDETAKKKYLQEATRYYFMLSQSDKTSIEAQIGLGRIYDEMKLDRLSKEHFFRAYNMDKNNPSLNYYFANYYYKRNDLINALKHYQAAYGNGYAANYYLNYRLGMLYEKLADIESSRNFYSKALKYNSKFQDARNKIRLLDDLNYSQSQYYLFKK